MDPIRVLVRRGGFIESEHTVHAVAVRDGEIVASTPDLIIVLDAETGEPITTENLRYGFRVVVLGLPCDARWRSEAGLKLVGPGYFGYDVPYVPVEERFGAGAQRGRGTDRWQHRTIAAVSSSPRSRPSS